MNAFDRYLEEVGRSAQKRRPMTRPEWRALIAGIGIPLAFLLILVAFCPR
ncbi:MAG: hypothetical protein GAK28_02423 [Luteibacter sp.]|nr:hypothetical protein [Luteibacter sp.]KAF1006747.1 MAG: hypothetical protein GAK28_02423 [Luteibacter sp.]